MLLGSCCTQKQLKLLSSIRAAAFAHEILLLLTAWLLLLQAWNTTGDSYSVNPGDKPWISEMYGYSYACAAADVWHKVDFSAMLYPAYFTTSKPQNLLLSSAAAL